MIALDKIKIHTDIQYKEIQGLSNEVIQKLQLFLPENLGQAARISGITPAAIDVLRIWLKTKKSYSFQKTTQPTQEVTKTTLPSA